MPTRLVPAVLLALAVSAPGQQRAARPQAAQQQAGPQHLDHEALLARLTDPHWLWRPPPAGERCVQFSSYDRRSERGPEHPDDWYANDDRGKYLRVEERDGQREHVMVDVEGPGAVARIWSANPSGVLHFDVDGERVWTVDFAALTGGRVEGVPEPLAGVRARGANCHLPIPFRERLVVSASKGDFYYQVNVVQFAKGTEVPSFRPEMLTSGRSAILAAVRRLQDRLVAAPLPAKEVGRHELFEPGTVLDSVEIVLRARPPGVDLGEALRQVLLVVRCGRDETVRVPLLDFFCGGADWRPHEGHLLGVRVDGSAYCNFPMPMPAGGKVELVADGDPQGVDPRLRVRVAPQRLAAGEEPLLFRASFHGRKDFASRPFHDHLALDATGGPGRYVGCSLLVKNPHRGWWGEGDEKFWVDGESFPSTFGTGTEDYFGYAWCSPALFSSAFHAQPQCDGPGNRGFTAVNRVHMLDSVPFAASFRFDLEVWHWVPDLKMDYATVAYWYGAPGAASGLPPVPAADARTLDRLPAPVVLAVEGAIEGESLRVVSCSGGRHEVQAMDFLEAAFSKDAQRWWMDGAVGDELVLALPAPAAGRYRVRGAFCRANDYGIAQCVLNGTELGEPIDFYAPRVGPTGVLDLGEADLAEGDNEFRLRLVGKNADAVDRRMVGLDYLLLERIERLERVR